MCPKKNSPSLEVLILLHFFSSEKVSYLSVVELGENSLKLVAYLHGGRADYEKEILPIIEAV